MAYDEFLAERIENQLKSKGVPHEGKKMMGGMCYMVDDKMCVGIIKNDLMARVAPDTAAVEMKKPGVKQMDFTGKPMKGYILVEPTAMDNESDLAYWIDLCLAFNPKAKSSKKKKPGVGQ